MPRKKKVSSEKQSEPVVLYTDGSYKPQSDVGGYAAYIEEEEKVVCGAKNNTTNNQMELLAVIHGLKEIDDNKPVKVITDSKYVCDTISKRWLYNWKRNNWKTSANTPVKNQELWEQLESEINKHPSVKFEWVKGHADTKGNNFCDAVATKITQCL